MIKKLIPILLISLILLLCSCENNDKELIETEVMNYIQVAPARVVAKYSSELPEINFVEVITQNLTYKITSVTIDSNVATVTVEINNVDLETAFIEATEEYLIWRNSTLTEAPTTPEKQLQTFYTTILLKKFALADSLPKVECIFKLTKHENNQWQITELDRDLLYKAITGNLFDFN